MNKAKAIGATHTINSGESNPSDVINKPKTNILLAPAALAAITVNKPIGPAPKIATVSPNRTSPSLIA